MSMFELQPVTLGDLEGQGYAFKRKTAFGQARRGIAYLNDEDQVDWLREQEAVTFTGPCYYKQRGARDREFDVIVEEVTPTRMGARVDFVEVDYPEQLLED